MTIIDTSAVLISIFNGIPATISSVKIHSDIFDNETQSHIIHRTLVYDVRLF